MFYVILAEQKTLHPFTFGHVVKTVFTIQHENFEKRRLFLTEESEVPERELNPTYKCYYHDLEDESRVAREYVI